MATTATTTAKKKHHNWFFCLWEIHSFFVAFRLHHRAIASAHKMLTLNNSADFMPSSSWLWSLLPLSLGINWIFPIIEEIVNACQPLISAVHVKFGILKSRRRKSAKLAIITFSHFKTHTRLGQRHNREVIAGQSWFFHHFHMNLFIQLRNHASNGAKTNSGHSVQRPFAMKYLPFSTKWYWNVFCSRQSQMRVFMFHMWQLLVGFSPRFERTVTIRLPKTNDFTWNITNAKWKKQHKRYEDKHKVFQLCFFFISFRAMWEKNSDGLTELLKNRLHFMDLQSLKISLSFTQTESHCKTNEGGIRDALRHIFVSSISIGVTLVMHANYAIVSKCKFHTTDGRKDDEEAIF